MSGLSISALLDDCSRIMAAGRRVSSPPLGWPPDDQRERRAWRERALQAEARVRALEHTVGELLDYADDAPAWVRELVRDLRRAGQA